MDKPTLILDLDDTLIKPYSYNINYIDILLEYCYSDKLDICIKNPELYPIILPNHNLSFNKDFLLSFSKGNNIYIIFKRPYLYEFIKEAFKYFNIYIYSLGSQEYVNTVIDYIISILEFNPFIDVFGNSSYEYKMDKDLIRYDLPDNSLIIDDRDDVWFVDYKNVFKIKKYNNNNNNKDDELFKLMNKFKSYFLINSFNLKELLNYLHK